MLLIGKWTQSIGVVVLIGSGMLRLPLAKFILVNLLATLPKSAVLFGVGYFAGGHFPLVEHHMVIATIMLGVAGVAATMLVLRRADDFGTGA
jgi:membrane protein DedA with SNARE-associated domain